MKRITSLSNPLIKDIKALHQKKGRDNSCSFIIEGYKFVKEAIKNNIELKLIAVREDFIPDSYLFDKAKEYIICSDQVFKKISSTETPTNILAVAGKMEYSLEDLINSKKENKTFVVLDKISDPGNLGTIIRTCAAANVDGLILTDFSVDIFNPKVVRSTAGTLWKIPVVCFEDSKKLINIFKDNHFSICCADISAKISHYSYNYKKNVALVFGSEAHGVYEIFKNFSDDFVKIPISDDVESLNVASSVAIILFEAVRQKEG